MCGFDSNNPTCQVKPLLRLLEKVYFVCNGCSLHCYSLSFIHSLPLVIRKGFFCCFEPLGRGKGQRNPTEAGNEFPVWGKLRACDWPVLEILNLPKSNAQQSWQKSCGRQMWWLLALCWGTEVFPRQTGRSLWGRESLWSMELVRGHDWAWIQVIFKQLFWLAITYREFDLPLPT